MSRGNAAAANDGKSASLITVPDCLTRTSVSSHLPLRVHVSVTFVLCVPGGGAGGAGAPLAPIGSDVRRRLGSHSLFYYGGAPAWPGPPAPREPPPPVPVPTPGQYLPRVLGTAVRWNEGFYI